MTAQENELSDYKTHTKIFINKNKKPKYNHIINKVVSFVYGLLKQQKKKPKKIEQKNIVQLTPTQIKAEQFISIQNYEVLEQMVKNGYELLPNQIKSVESYLESLLTAHNNKEEISNKHNKIEIWLELGINLKEETKENYFQQLVYQRNQLRREEYNLKRKRDFNTIYPLAFFYTDSGNMNKELTNGTTIEFPLLTKHLKTYAKNHKLFYDAFITIINTFTIKEGGIYNYYDNKEYKDVLSEILTDDRKHLLLKEIDFERFLQITAELNNRTEARDYQEIKELLQSILAEHYKDNVKEIVSNVKKEYSESYIEKVIIHSVKEESLHITISNLPDGAKDKLKEIHILYRKIHNSNIKPTETEWYNINNLFEKRIPEILKKYLTIDEQYQTTLTNANGKNAQELMIDSLDNIYANFEQTWKSMNNDAVSSLSATNKYTQNFNR